MRRLYAEGLLLCRISPMFRSLRRLRNLHAFIVHGNGARHRFVFCGGRGRGLFEMPSVLGCAAHSRRGLIVGAFPAYVDVRRCRGFKGSVQGYI